MPYPKYYRWNHVDFNSELDEFLSILRANIDSQGVSECIPNNRKGYLPQHYKAFSEIKKVPRIEKSIDNWGSDVVESLVETLALASEFGLDIYTVEESVTFNLRVGRKDKNEKAEWVLLEFRPTPTGLYHRWRYHYDGSTKDDRDTSLVTGELPEVVVQDPYFPFRKEKYPVARDAYWPSDYTQISNANSTSELEQHSKESCMSKPSLNQILFGPPGTGKTYNTIEKAVMATEPNFDWYGDRDVLKEKYKCLVDENRIRFVTFHQSYGYEEFVEGLSVKVVDGQPHYFVKEGIFKSIVKEANSSFESEEDTQNYVLVIDEINRGNISKIFGELITLIEKSKRKGEKEAIELDLPYSGEKFSVPNNLILIGTMNTADRSLAVMDTALRRRFDFTEMMPNSSVLKPKSSSTAFDIDLVTLLDTMNQRIEYLLDREHTLGHAFFIDVTELVDENKPDEAFSKLKEVFQNKVLPLLQEYFFDDWQKIRLVLGDNQKQDQRLVFVTSQSVELKVLFGSDEIGQFGEQESKFTLAPHGESVWDTVLAYKGIYEVVS